MLHRPLPFVFIALYIQGVQYILCFSFKVFEFYELCQFCCSAGVLPACCVYTHWHREKTKLDIYIKTFEKTQYLMNTLYFYSSIFNLFSRRETKQGHTGWVAGMKRIERKETDRAREYVSYKRFSAYTNMFGFLTHNI